MNNLNSLYSINVRYQRSTRIDSDLDKEFFPGLVYHGTARQTLTTISAQFSQAKQSTFTVTGPYGSGKSTVALLLGGLLHHDQALREAALSSMGGITEAKNVLDAFKPQGPEIKGWLLVRAVGGVGGPLGLIWTSIVNALKEHPNTQGHEEITSLAPRTDEELLSRIESLLKDIQPHVDGVLFLLDEMGKVLEHISREGDDLHLFQDLAEKLSRASQSTLPCLFVGLLHQAISEYAAGRGAKIQQEWGKVQGRYSDIPYQVSADETIALIQKSIAAKSDSAAAQGSEIGEQYANEVLAAIDGSSLKHNEELVQRLGACYPLHPATVILLGPISKRRFSQNERSTFSFLNSREPDSFQEFLKQKEMGESYRLPQLWDYLETNLQHLIAVSRDTGDNDAHTWNLAQYALTRAHKIDGLSSSHVELLKSIALINIFGRQNSIFASPKLLTAALGWDDVKTVSGYLDTLKKHSLVTERKHIGAWAIFEGSDIDLSELLAKKLEQLETDDTWLDNIDYSAMTIAKRHYHQKGVLRWMSHQLIKDESHFGSEDFRNRQDGSFASFVLIGEGSTAQRSPSHLKALSDRYCDAHIAVAACPNFDAIKQAAIELYALQLIERETPELQNDRVAQKELNVALVNAKHAFQNSYEEAFRNAEWFYGDAPCKDAPLSVVASEIADDIYGLCPPIFNELVGRSKISGTSVSARKKLLYRMISCSNEPNLGIEGFPPEMAIYLTCLKNLGFHVPLEGGSYGFRLPQSGSICHMMRAAESLIKEANHRVVSLEEVYTLWQSSPYGVAPGIIPILVLALLLSKEESLAYYDKDNTNQFVYIPDPDEDFVDKMIRIPKDVGVRYFEVEGVKRHYITSLAKIAGQHFDREIAGAALAVARPIVTFVHQLPQWIKVTKKLTDKTQQFRDLVLKANDPYKLLLEDFGRLFHTEDQRIEDDASDLQSQLSYVLEELKSVQNELLSDFRTKLIDELGPLDEKLIERCGAVREAAADYRLQAFAQRLSQCSNTGDRWIVNVIALVSGTPERSWNDVTLAKAREELVDYCQRFKRISLFSNHSNVDKNHRAIAVVVGDGESAQEFVRHVKVEKEALPTLSMAKRELIALLKSKGLTDDQLALTLQETLVELMTEQASPACAVNG